jgi:flagellar motor switch protein FliN
MENQNNHQAARTFADAFVECFAQSLSEAAGAPWKLEDLDSPDLSKQQGRAIHIRLTVYGELSGQFFVEFHEPQINALVSAVCGQPIETFGDEHRDALEKVISSAMAKLVESRASEFGELTFKVEAVSSLAYGGMFVIPLAASGADQPGIPISLYFDSELLAALSIRQPAKDVSETERTSIDPVNLKLVMDVELNVSLRFGQRQLPLREVLELGSGSVIELDRQVDEPVELLLDGKVIARGEAVIVDGNYGLRITEIPQPIASHFIR